MTINAVLLLYISSYRMWLGGANSPLAKKEISLEITPTVLEKLLSDRTVCVSGIDFVIREEYTAAKNTVILQGHMTHHDEDEKMSDEMKRLESEGWEFDKELWNRYGFKS